jgi:predicted CXXCH cytochrome family protein
MKKSLKNVVCLLALVAITSPTFAAITSSAHDFSGESWTSEICNVCHTPHNGTIQENSPLWDHDLTSETGYSLYTGVSIQATDLGQPTSGISKLCLSCHDGTIALDSFGGAVGADFILDGEPGYIGGTDLSNDHPISFTYDTTLADADGSLHNPAVVTTELGDTIDADLLFGGKVECASCHDVHNAADEAYLLVINNDGSDLCLTCHDK